MARAGRWERAALHPVPEHPTSQAVGTEYFSLVVEDVPAAASRPDRLAGVRPQERVLRHAVEQFGDVAPGLPALGVPVPQMVDKLEDVLKIVEISVPVQEIGMPKISSLSRPPLRRVLPVPQTAEQLVDVPVPDVILAHGRCDLGVNRCQIATRGGRCYWWIAGTRHVQWRRPEGFTASPGRYTGPDH